MRREQHPAGDDHRVLIFLADLFPVIGVGEDVLVRLEIFFRFEGGGFRLLARIRRGTRGLALRAAVHRHVHQRQYVGVHDAQIRFHPQLAAEQPHRLHVAVHIVGAARESVNRQLQAWRKEAILDLQRGRILLRNMTKLTAIARNE